MCDQTTPAASAATGCCTAVLAIAIALTLSTRSTAACNDPMRTWTMTTHAVMREVRCAVSRVSHPSSADGRSRDRMSARAATPGEHEIAARFRDAFGTRLGEAQAAPDG